MSPTAARGRVHLLPPLPYALDALAPLISEETLRYHYGQHHRAYVEALNKLIVGTEFAASDLVETVRRSSGTVFRQAAQAWNHSFYWRSLSPDGGKAPAGPLAEAMRKQFGSVTDCVMEFTAAATAKFGSGWIWLVRTASGKLEILATDDADTPIRHGKRPLLTCDVWEHAYYIDYRNDRAKYLASFWRLANWNFAADNFGQA